MILLFRNKGQGFLEVTYVIDQQAAENNMEVDAF